MSVLPVDLQVLFTKATDIGQNVAKHAAANEVGNHDAKEKVHQNNLNAHNKVQKTDEYQSEFSKTNRDGKNPNQQEEENQGEKHQGKSEEDQIRTSYDDYQSTGHVIDIID